MNAPANCWRVSLRWWRRSSPNRCGLMPRCAPCGCGTGLPPATVVWRRSGSSSVVRTSRRTGTSAPPRRHCGTGTWPVTVGSASACSRYRVPARSTSTAAPPACDSASARWSGPPGSTRSGPASTTCRSTRRAGMARSSCTAAPRARAGLQRCHLPGLRRDRAVRGVQAGDAGRRGHRPGRRGHRGSRDAVYAGRVRHGGPQQPRGPVLLLQSGHAPDERGRFDGEQPLFVAAPIETARAILDAWTRDHPPARSWTDLHPA
jgi:hypothetical protein